MENGFLHGRTLELTSFIFLTFSKKILFDFRMHTVFTINAHHARTKHNAHFYPDSELDIVTQHEKWEFIY